MDFSSIIYKNLKHNFNKYMAVFFVNTFIIAILFIYGSLLFNTLIEKEIGSSVIFENIRFSFLIIVLFSISFISYTTISFMKSRGKEFGVYLTLGMTTKNLRMMILLENTAILMTSVISGLVSGLVFSRLFYMAIGKILSLKSDIYEISPKTFFLSIGVFLFIFIISTIFSNIYVYRLSIIEIMKAKSKKEVGKTRLILGSTSLILFVLSLYLLPKVIFEGLFQGNGRVIVLLIALTVICPYFIIGSILGLVKNLIKRFPQLYNNNLLVLSNLSHRFLAYKTILYIVTILVGGAIYFIGISYSLYAGVEAQIDANHPYDIMFVQKDKYNNINPSFIEKVLKNRGEHFLLEGLNVGEYRGFDGKVIFRNDNTLILKESNYNKHVNGNLSLKQGELAQVTNSPRMMGTFKDSDVILTFDGIENINNRRKLFDENYEANYTEFLKVLDKNTSLRILKDKKIYISNPYLNEAYSEAYSTNQSFVLDDEDYERIESKISKEDNIKFHLINIKGRSREKNFNMVLEELRKINNIPSDEWKGNKVTIKGSKGIDSYRPIFKDEILNIEIGEKGVLFFSMIFLGLIFLTSSGVVLYYKLVTDLDNEKERIEKIKVIGVTEKELKTILLRELKILFFTPAIMGVGISYYHIQLMYTTLEIRDLLIEKTLAVICVYIGLQIMFYLMGKRKYLRGIRV